jgi:hypothetical protein
MRPSSPNSTGPMRAGRGGGGERIGDSRHRRRAGATLPGAERSAAYRARRKAELEATGKPIVRIRYRKSQDKRSRTKRWADAGAELVDLQADYAAWLEALPESLRDTPTADALRAICDFDLAELEALEPPKGFGRD